MSPTDVRFGSKADIPLIPCNVRVAALFVATQYEIPFKLSISTFHVSVMAITPAIVSHKVRHPSPSNFSAFMAPRQLAAVTPKRGWGVRGHGAKDAMQMSECGSEIGQRILPLCT